MKWIFYKIFISIVFISEIKNDLVTPKKLNKRLSRKKQETKNSPHFQLGYIVAVRRAEYQRPQLRASATRLRCYARSILVYDVVIW